jgi:APA family basic amino acid/polyamine antiporter
VGNLDESIMSKADAGPVPAPRLERGLGGLDATMIVMGSMIGSGIFITSAESARLAGSPGLLLLAWALAGLLTVCGAICAAEVAAMIPKAGGQYVFLREAYGPSVGFLFGWSAFLVVGTGTIAAVAVAFAKFLGVLLPTVASDRYLVAPIHLGRYALSLSSQQLVAVGLIALLTATNMRGLETGRRIQNVFTFSKIAALLALIIAGLALGRVNPLTSSWLLPDGTGDMTAIVEIRRTLPVGGLFAIALVFGKAMVGPLFSQTAWNSVTFTGGEVRDPGRTLPRALMIGCSSVVALYLMANLSYLRTLPFADIQGAPQDRVATLAMQRLLGDPGTTVMAALILVSTFGCNNGLILSGARVFYAMARDGLFFRAAGTTNANRVPAVALVAQGVWASFLVLPVTVKPGAEGIPEYGNLYGQLLDYIIPVDLLFYTVMVASVLVLRARRPGAERPYRTFGYPLTPVIYITLATFLIADFVYLSPDVSGIGFLIALSGLPVYWAWSRLGQAPATSA